MKTLSWENKDPPVVSPRYPQGCVQGCWCCSIVSLGSACTYPSWLLHPPWILGQSKVSKGRYQICHTLSVFGVSLGGGRRDHILHIPCCVSSDHPLLHRSPCAAEHVGLAPASLQACGRDKQWNVLLNRKLYSVHSSSSPCIGILFSSLSS